MGVHPVKLGENTTLHAAAKSDGAFLARDLANERGDIMGPERVEEVARILADKHETLRFYTIAGLEALEAKRLHMLAAVGRSGKQQPRLVVLEYRGRPASPASKGAGTGTGEAETGFHPSVALVGKGITFDSGGLNLKPTGSIETMHLVGLLLCVSSPIPRSFQTCLAHCAPLPTPTGYGGCCCCVGCSCYCGRSRPSH
jgi:leucyl aminopeptidase